MKHTEKSGTPLEAQVCVRGGKPVLLVNGRSVAPLIYSLANAPGGRWSWEEVPSWNIRNFAEHGFDLFQMPLWFEDIWQEDGSLCMDTAFRQIQGVLAVQPSAGLFLRLIISPPIWWYARNPQECTLYADGPVQPNRKIGTRPMGGGDLQRVQRPSLASEKWRADAEAKIREFCRLLSSAPEGDCVIGLHVADGVYHEWHYWGFIEHEPDVSVPMTNEFRRQLTAKYGTDANLQKAWARPDVRLATASVPGMEERLHPRAGIFRDPQQERNVLDYNRCQHEAVAQSIIRACTAVKESWPRPVITGVFYGYFFSLFARQAAGGHLAMDTILRSPAVDYLSAPQSYFREHRKMGGTAQSRGLAESCRLHGKLWLDEMDQATHTDVLRPSDIEHVNKTLAEDIIVARRNAAQPFTKGMGMWFYDFGPRDISGWWDHPEMMADIAKLKSILDRYYDREYVPQADVLVVYDAEVFYGLGGTRALDPVTDPLCVNLASTAFFHSGTVCDMVYLQDLERVDADRYRVVVFANTFVLTEAQKELIRTRLAGEGRHLIWNYAPGYSNGERLDAALVADITGIGIEKRPCPRSLAMASCFDQGRSPVDYMDPSYNRLYNQFNKTGQEGKLPPFDPFFVVADPEAEKIAWWQGEESTAIACKNMDGWTSWYCSLPITDEAVLREVLRRGGAHIYAEDGDPLHSGNGILLAHTASGGNRRITLRNGVAVQLQLAPCSTVILDNTTGEVLLR
jgi:hypothetical protein